MYTTLLFDLDNTLIDRDAAVRAFYRERLRQFSPSKISLLDELLAFDNSGRGSRDEFLEWYQKNVSPDASPRELLIEMRFGIMTKIRAYSGVKSLLKNLSGQYTLGLLSNGSSEGQRLKLAAAGLEKYFDPGRILISGDTPYQKPDVEIFRNALESLGADPEETLMIGDDPRNDIAGAAEAGIGTCWVSRGQAFAGDRKPDFTVEKTTQIAEILGS